MASTGPSPLNRLAELTRAAVETQARLGREYAELARSTLTNDGDRVAAGRAYLESVRRESERYWRAFSDLGVGYAEDVVRLGSRASSAVASDVRSAMRRSHGTGQDGTGHGGTGQDGADHAAHDHPAPAPRDADAPTRAQPEVAMHGPLGGIATARVTVANQHPRARRIALTPSPLTDAQGEVVEAEVEAEPTTVTVPAGAESQVTLSVSLTEPAFAAGHDYTGTVEVSGGAQATLTVLLHVDPAS